MHRYRGAAKRAAWYDDAGDAPNYNPFRKNLQRKLSSVEDEESRIHTTYSENNMMSSAESNRQFRNGDRYPLPKHAETMPSPSSSAPNGPIPIIKEPTPEALREKTRESTEKSQDSGLANSDETKVERDLTDDSVPIADQNTGAGKRARRRKFGLAFGSKKDQDSGVGGKPSKKLSFFKKSKEGQTFTVASQIRATLLNSWVNVLLIFVPVGIAVNYAGVNKIAVFVINFIAIIPLAGMLSYATEEIALRVGETIGGLLNATFGNAVELIVSILALADNQVDIVQESLIGSMLSNLLLVMGMCFFFGGITRIKQNFNMTVAQTASSLLALAIASLIIPAAFVAWANADADDKVTRVTELSRGTAILLLLVYAAYLLFQLKTHVEIYNAPSEKVEKRTKKVDDGAASKGLANMGAGMSASMGGHAAQETPVREPEDPGEQPQLSKWVAMATLAISTALVALCAEYMVDSINAITESGSVSRTFVGLILLPIVGNAAEHATAVTVACKDKMDLAIGVAVGSSMQIALLVIPFIVVLGWIMGKDTMNLDFDAFQITVLFVSILLVNYLIQDGESHWLEGVMLMTLYVIIAIAAWYYLPAKKAEDSVSASRMMAI